MQNNTNTVCLCFTCCHIQAHHCCCNNCILSVLNLRNVFATVWEDVKTVVVVFALVYVKELGDVATDVETVLPNVVPIAMNSFVKHFVLYAF